ncbi:hypothetical protein [Tautonia plasticadhaerens]|uniref:hypothetical protein n=1 Tax=Tautonia plasticadhaerens TaxID=2527974 RepID=UPI00119F7BE6|nr:hypothetical protein [Tautonia plasticadhaerens]
MIGSLDPDLVGLPPAFAIRVYLHRRGWTTRQATVAGGSRHVAAAERDAQRIRCEAEHPEAAWTLVLRSACASPTDVASLEPAPGDPRSGSAAQ